MKKITQFSVNYPFGLMIVMGCAVARVHFVLEVGIDLFPKLNSPRLYIELDAGDRPPEEVENLSSKTLNRRQSVNPMWLRFRRLPVLDRPPLLLNIHGKRYGRAYLDLQKAMNSYTQNSDIEELTISQYDPNATPIMVVSIENENLTNLDEVRKVAENYVRNELIRIEALPM
jgi:HAE1 family hydrophobic/amphiphilic exporter-1